MHKINKEVWVPANGGTETPYVTKSGHKVLYMWNKKTGEHAYLDLSRDIFLTREEEALINPQKASFFKKTLDTL